MSDTNSNGSDTDDDATLDEELLAQGPPKTMTTSAYPVHALRTSGLFASIEPLITAKQLKRRYLMGINLTMPNGDRFTDEDLTDYISIQMTKAELELKLPIEPKEFRDRLPFDLNLYKNFVHVKTTKGPILTVKKFFIESSNNIDLFNIPPEWIDNGQFDKRQINVIPYLSSSGVMLSNSPAGAGSMFLASMGGYRWIPSYWSLIYDAGIMDTKGQLPKPVNDLIGTMTTIFILSQLGPTVFLNSQSLSQDGISQSSSGPGIARYAQRLQELELTRLDLIAKIRGDFSTKLIVGSL